MLSNVNIVIISRSPPGMKSATHRPLGQPQQRTVAFRQIPTLFPHYTPTTPTPRPFLLFRGLFFLWAGYVPLLLLSLFEFQWKDDRRVNPLSRPLICWGKHVSSRIRVHQAERGFEPNASLVSGKTTSFSGGERQLVARLCALWDRYRF